MRPDGGAVGAEIGNYRLIELIGRGGVGCVYLARHKQLNKEIAVKLIRPELADHPEITQRFLIEARAAGEIGHENIVEVLDYGLTPSGEPYLFMEYLRGQSLTDVVRTSAPLSASRLGHIGLQICSALSAAHGRGIIHRDLKCDNILVLDRPDREDFVKVLDFGIAKLVGESEPALKTQAGVVMGTPLTMSPEQALGEEVGPQTDVYALGVLLYIMATGAPPFYSQNPIALANMHITAAPRPPSERVPSLSPALEEVILRCLEKDRARRFFSMAEVAAALGAVCDEAKDAPTTTGRRAVLAPYTGETEALPASAASPGDSFSKLATGELFSRLVEAPEVNPAARRPRRRALATAGALAVLGLAGYLALPPGATAPKGARLAARPEVAPARAAEPASIAAAALPPDARVAPPASAPGAPPIADESAPASAPATQLAPPKAAPDPKATKKELPKKDPAARGARSGPQIAADRTINPFRR